MHDFGERHGPFFHYVGTSANSAAKELNITNIITKGGTPSLEISVVLKFIFESLFINQVNMLFGIDNSSVARNCKKSYACLFNKQGTPDVASRDLESLRINQNKTTFLCEIAQYVKHFCYFARK